jgi:hypothetical protein
MIDRLRYREETNAKQQTILRSNDTFAQDALRFFASSHIRESAIREDAAVFPSHRIAIYF